MRPRPKHERIHRRTVFVSHYLKSLNATKAAIAAGYSKKTAYSIGQRLLKNVETQKLIAEYNAKVASDAICGLAERKEILSQIARGRLTQFGEFSATGFVPDIGPENPHVGALAEVTTHIESSGTGDGKTDAWVHKVKLKDSVQAIGELNKMEGVYKAADADLDDSLQGKTIIVKVTVPWGKETEPKKVQG